MKKENLKWLKDLISEATTEETADPAEIEKLQKEAELVALNDDLYGMNLE